MIHLDNARFPLSCDLLRTLLRLTNSNWTWNFSIILRWKIITIWATIRFDNISIYPDCLYWQIATERDVSKTGRKWKFWLDWHRIYRLNMSLLKLLLYVSSYQNLKKEICVFCQIIRIWNSLISFKLLICRSRHRSLRLRSLCCATLKQLRMYTATIKSNYISYSK